MQTLIINAHPDPQNKTAYCTNRLVDCLTKKLPDATVLNLYNEDIPELIAKALQPGDVVVLLDEHGKEMRSVEFARWMEKKLVNVNKRLVFIIGGPYGFSQKVYDAAHEKISMSKMTFSHQMIRLIFVEQIYRAMTILNGGPYHHE